MSLPMPANVTVDIYRTANPGAPYTLGAAGAAGVKGYLKPLVGPGRNGTASWLKWTHLLYLPPEIDVSAMPTTVSSTRPAITRLPIRSS